MYWPEVFKKNKINYPNTTEGKGAACADGNCAWGNCMAGTKPPKTFGETMAKISLFLGISGTPEDFKKYSKQWRKERDKKHEN